VKITRRGFLHAIGVLAPVTLIPNSLEAWRHGNFAQSSNLNRVVVNVPQGCFMNLAKGFSFNFTGGTALDANGYPTGSISANANPSLRRGYYGKYVWSFTGSSSQQFVGECAIVYSGGADVVSLTSGGSPAGAGYAAQNFSVNPAAVNPRIVFKLGALVTAVSGGGGSLVTVTIVSVNFGTGFSTGMSISFNQGCSANLVNGPNQDGSWTITKVSGTQFTLDGSTGVVAPSVTGAGGVGVQTEAVRGTTLVTFGYTGASSGLSNLVVCAEADEAAIISGLIYDQTLVDQLLELKGTPGGVGRAGDFWLRFMDTAGGNGSFEADFSQRKTLTTQSWTTTNPMILAYNAGAITNGGASGSYTDVYTCASNPTNSPASGPPIDCEVIQGVPSATNTGGYPALTVAGRVGFGTWPIINTNIEPIILPFSTTPASAGLSMQYTFTASWLNGGVPYVFTYTTVAGDVANVNTLKSNLQAALVADLVLRAGKIVFTNSGNVVVYPPTPLSGTLTVAYTSGPAIATVVSLGPSTITAGSNRTFIFNALLGAFMYSTTYVQNIPMEAMVDLCNRVGACLWYTFPIYTKASFITDFTSWMAGSTFTSGLKFGGEVGNEIWNFSLPNWGKGQAFGIALGCFSYPYGSNAAPYSWQGLRTKQYAALMSAAWTRSASDLRVFSMTQTADTTINGNWDRNCLKGTFLVTSNANFAAYGGIGGTSVPISYDTVGNRPVDITTDIGVAPYWSSQWMGGGGTTNSSRISGTVAQNAPLLQASLDFVQGNTLVALTAMSNMSNGTTTRAVGSSGQQPLVPNYASVFAAQETLAAQYDAYRAGAGLPVLKITHYEGGFQGGMGANLNNGFNSSSVLPESFPAGDITALASAVTALGGDVSPYTVSGTNDSTEMATQLFQVQQGWKYDVDVTGAPAGTGAYKNLIKTHYYGALRTAHPAAREAKGGQYGYSGNSWALWWFAYNYGGEPYQSYDAIAEFNL
jgi:hypothetical protein